MTLVKDMPVYVQIKDYIKDLILSGMLQENEKLPATRELASILGVSRNTVVAAYEFLQDEGFIHMVKGKGAFVSEVYVSLQEQWSIDWSKRMNDYAQMAEKLDIVRHEVRWEKGMISFKSISPDEKLFDVEDLKKAFLNRMSLEGEKLLNYGYAKGYKPLMDYLMKYMKNKGVNTEGKDILITNGFTEGFDILLSSLTTEGDTVLCENPTHNTAIKIMKLHKLNIVGISMDEGGLNLEEMDEKLKMNDVKLGYFIPSYHNPTGTVMSPDKRVEAYNMLRKYNVPIIEDGFNEELRYSGAHVAPMIALSGHGNSVIYAGSFSKVLFPGMRIGWILGDEKLIECLESVKRSRNIHTSFMDQAILYEYFKNGCFEKYIRRVRKVYKEKYEFAMQCARKYLKGAQIFGEGGLHLFVKIKGVDSRELLDKCIEKGVIYTPGDIFYMDDSVHDTFRLGFARLELQDIERGMAIIGEAVSEMKSY